MIEPSRLGFYSDIDYKAIETQHMLRLYNWVFIDVRGVTGRSPSSRG